MTYRILLLSTVHPPVDPRIVMKIAPALSGRYEVCCALPQAESRHGSPGVTMINLPFYKRLISRLLLSYPVVIWRCLRLKPDLLYIFVPELIPLAFLFKWRGARVIFEVQENLYVKFGTKRYNKGYIFRVFYGFFERLARRNFSYVFTEHAYTAVFTGLVYPFAVIHNYVSLPLVDSIMGVPVPPDGRQGHVFFYAGVVSSERSIDVMIRAFEIYSRENTEFTVKIFGRLNMHPRELQAIPEFGKVSSRLTFYGYTDQRKALLHGANAIAGIALLKPSGDYMESYPTKLFEYMAMGLPVITSDFPLYREIIETHRCGFCVSPFDEQAVAEAMAWLSSYPEKAAEMGARGRKAVELYYNWNTEEQALLRYCGKLLASD